MWKRTDDISGYTERPRGESAPARNEVTRHMPTLRVFAGYSGGLSSPRKVGSYRSHISGGQTFSPAWHRQGLVLTLPFSAS